jgi:hypothetical protein
MATTYVQIGSTVTVGSGGAASIDFSSIPSTYTDLVLLTSLRSTRTANTEDAAKMEFNGVTTGYSYRQLRGTGSAAESYTGTSAFFLQNQNASSSTSSTFTNSSTYIPNYAGSQNKSLSVDSAMENNATSAFTNLVAGLWSNTAAITSIKLTPNVGPLFAEYSTATLYGISKS